MGLAVIATLIVVVVAWKQISRAIRLAQPEVSLGPADELLALPVTLIARETQPTFALPVFAALPETELRESTLLTSYRLLKDTTPLAAAAPRLATLQGGAIPVLQTENFVPGLPSISPTEAPVLRPITKIRKIACERLPNFQSTPMRNARPATNRSTPRWLATSR